MCAMGSNRVHPPPKIEVACDPKGRVPVVVSNREFVQQIHPEGKQLVVELLPPLTRSTLGHVHLLSRGNKEN